MGQHSRESGRVPPPHAKAWPPEAEHKALLWVEKDVSDRVHMRVMEQQHALVGPANIEKPQASIPEPQQSRIGVRPRVRVELPDSGLPVKADSVIRPIF